MAKEKKEFDINGLVNKLKKNYGSLRVAADTVEVKEFISTGNKALDLALEGGINFGSLVELSGFSQSGKTTIMQIMLANMQKDYNAVGIWLDRENAFYNNRSEFLGIDLKRTILFKPLDIITVPQATIALEEVLKNIPDDTYKFIAIDSLAAFDDTSKSDKSVMGKTAGQFHRLFRRILPFVNDKTIFIFANQRTFKPNVMFGDNTTTAGGGESGKYYSHYRIQLDQGKEIKDPKRDNEVVGNWMRAIVEKTRSGPSRRKIYFQHIFKEGVHYLSGYVRFLVSRNILQPKNKAEFKSFKNEIILYKDKKLKESDVNTIIETYPELNYDIYPEYNVEEEKIEEENTSE